MKLIEDIEKYFNEHKDFDDFTKIRYIYLYICKTFSYDLRYYQADKNLKDSIYNDVIDIKNVKKYEYVCSSITNALVNILKYFGFNAKIQQEDNSNHLFAIVECNQKEFEYKLKLDPTKRHDLTRVKLDSPTIDFIDLTNSKFFIDDLIYSDKLIKDTMPKINHEEHYDTITIKELNTVINESAKNRNLTESQLFNEMIEYITCLINIRKDLKRYDDMDNYYSYILHNFKIYDESISKYLKPAIFFNKDYNEVIWLTDANYKDLYHYMFVMKKNDDGYKIEKINKEQAFNYLNCYTNNECQNYFYKFASDLPNDTMNKSK